MLRRDSEAAPAWLISAFPQQAAYWNPGRLSGSAPGARLEAGARLKALRSFRSSPKAGAAGASPYKPWCCCWAEITGGAAKAPGLLQLPQPAPVLPLGAAGGGEPGAGNLACPRAKKREQGTSRRLPRPHRHLPARRSPPAPSSPAPALGGGSAGPPALPPAAPPSRGENREEQAPGSTRCARGSCPPARSLLRSLPVLTALFFFSPPPLPSPPSRSGLWTSTGTMLLRR